MARAKRGYAVSEEAVTRMVAMCRNASPEQWTAATLWYRLHGQAVIREGAKAGLDAATSCAIFAALSPQTRIQVNWRNYRKVLADMSMRDVKYATKPMRKKIDGLLAGSFTIADATRGDKVTAFYHNLMGDESHVTIDTHMVNCIRNEAKRGKGPKGCKYQEYAAHIKVVATILGITPAQTQALLWVLWREAQGIADDGGMALVA